MNLFGRLIPWWVPLAVIGALVALLLGQQAQVSNAKARVARAEAALSDYRATAEKARADAERSARQEEGRRAEATRKVIQDARDEATAARDAASAADRAADGLRQRVAALVAASRATSNPATGGRGQGEQTSDALDVLANVFARTDQAAGELAAYADSLGAAGRACERQYDSLTASQPLARR